MRNSLQLCEPTWVQTWRSRVEGANQGPDSPVGAAGVASVVEAVRRGVSLHETAEVCSLSVSQVLGVVTQVGSRCTQIGKTATKASAIHAAVPGSRARVQHTAGSRTAEVFAADGWLRSRRQGDVRRAYAAILLASPEVLSSAISRVCGESRNAPTMRYTHLADLHGAARGVLPALDEVITAPVAAAVYLQAWDRLEATVATAVRAARELLADPDASRVRELVRDAFWLIPHAGVLDQAAAACEQARSGSDRMRAESRLRHQLAALKHLAARTPRRLFPNRFEQISVVQMRAIAASWELHPADGSGAREESALELFASAARTAARDAQLV